MGQICGPCKISVGLVNAAHQSFFQGCVDNDLDMESSFRVRTFTLLSLFYGSYGTPGLAR